MKVGVRVLFEIFDENLWIYLFEIISTRLTVKVPFLFKHVFPTPQRSPSHVVDFHGFGVCVSIKQVFNSAFSQVFRIACHVFSLILLCLYVKLKKYYFFFSLSARNRAPAAKSAVAPPNALHPPPLPPEAAAGRSDSGRMCSVATL